MCVAAVALWLPPAAAADIGFPGPTFTAADVDKPSGQKPQSKLWFHDGAWWGSLFASEPDAYRVFRLDPLTNTWVDTGTPLDDRNSSEADVLWDGSHLYVASASNLEAGIRVYRLSYDAGRWTRDDLATIAAGPVEAVVLDQDTTGRLWLTYTSAGNVYVAHTGSGGEWGTPYELPITNADDLASDDLSAIVAYGGRIGVMWSNQHAQAMFFASHADGAPDTAWTQTTALSGPFAADDHINLKSVQGGDGRVFAAVKTSNSDDPAHTADDQVDLLELRDDDWTRHVFGTVADDHTRPIVLTDRLTRRLYVFATSPTVPAGGVQTIFYKATDLDAPSFAPGPGTAFIRNDAGDVNDATSTKQDLSVAPQLVVLASDLTDYWHNALPLAHPTPTPTPTLTATPTATPVTTPVAPVTQPPPPPPLPPAPPIGPATTIPSDVTRPRLTHRSARPRRFRTRTRVRFTLSERATVRLHIERATKGRRVGGRCVRRTRSNRRKHVCRRYVVLRRGARTRKLSAGRHRLTFKARRLRAGRYRLVLVATDTAGNRRARHLTVRVRRR